VPDAQDTKNLRKVSAELSDLSLTCFPGTQFSGGFRRDTVAL
jgi:hypothetical protein